MKHEDSTTKNTNHTKEKQENCFRTFRGSDNSNSEKILFKNECYVIQGSGRIIEKKSPSG